MGCASSKLDDQPAVALCRDRCGFLHEAIQQRFDLAQAHIFYLHSLRRIGASLHKFIDQDSGGAPLSPKLNLPPYRKGDPISFRHEGSSSPPHKAHHLDPGQARLYSRSNSGSNLQLHSEDFSNDEDDSMSHLHHSDHPSPLHDRSGSSGGHIEFTDSDYMNPVQDSFSGGGFLRMNYMKNKAAPSSAVFEQMPVSHETVHFGESSSSSSYYYNNNPTNPYAMNNSAPYPYIGYPNYGGAGGGGGPMRAYYGSLPPYGTSSPPPDMASSTKPPPPPPSPPRASAWDFLNPFESYDKYYSPNTPSRDSRELREEEGIPDLEDEDDQHEVVKEVDGTNNYSKSVMIDDVGDGKPSSSSGAVDAAEASLYQARPSVSLENDGMEYKVRVVGNKVFDGERSEEHSKGRSGGPLDASQVAFEIKIQFEKASDCGNEIAKMLEAGKLPYRPKHVSKMLWGITPSLSVVSSHPSTSKSAVALSSVDKAGPAYLDIDEDVMMRSKDLSSILQKLYLWEKKLYNEVKAEEKMRVDHDRKCRKLKRLDERGAEAHKVDATQTIIRSLSTKIRIAIQVVDKFSMTINKIRDEELWPLLNELIQGLKRMWKIMLECHHNQCEAIREARNLGHIGSGKKLSDDHLQATLQLEREILNWTSSFASWIGAQKGYVRALNNWLVKCLLYEPEVTADGIVPFSPGRLGAPPVFVICNQWAQALDRISEKEVIDAMCIFAKGIFHLWEQDAQEMRERMMINKDLERKVRNLDREDQKIQKEIQALDKKIVLVAGDGVSLSLTGNVVYQSDTSNDSLKGSLQRIFEAMERFMGDSVKVYEDLMQRSEEERLAREHKRVS
uniref:Uncharacterized protein n=1 Tax=Rhizophora mucronata TaxID=61149 RepID=A0A2P2NIR6_RHIMU